MGVRGLKSGGWGRKDILDESATRVDQIEQLGRVPVKQTDGVTNVGVQAIDQAIASGCWYVIANSSARECLVQEM